MTSAISTTDLQSHYVEVAGAKLHYLEAGRGDPIIFLHGVPTSSFLWREIIPHLASLGHCIAPDLIGFGQSAKPNIQYTLHDHINYIEKFIDVLNLKNITFVLHAWGSVIGFDYAMRHPKMCKGLVFYEAYLKALKGEDFSLPYREQIYTLQKQINNVELIAQAQYFVDQIISQAVIHPLSPEVMAHYKGPFSAPQTGKPLYQYLRDINGEDINLNQFLENYSEKLMKSSLPKLLLYAIPGFLTTIHTIQWAKDNLPNLEIIEIGEAMHYAQETNPTVMGEAISVWMQGIEQLQR